MISGYGSGGLKLRARAGTFVRASRLKFCVEAEILSLYLFCWTPSAPELATLMSFSLSTGISLFHFEILFKILKHKVFVAA